MEEPEESTPPDSPQDRDAIPSLGKLVAGGVLGGIALARGLSVAAGIARVVAPGVVGYLAREILEARAKEPVTPAVSDDSENAGAAADAEMPPPAAVPTDEDDPGDSHRVTVPENAREVPAVWKEDPSTPESVSDDVLIEDEVGITEGALPTVAEEEEPPADMAMQAEDVIEEAILVADESLDPQSAADEPQPESEIEIEPITNDGEIGQPPEDNQTLAAIGAEITGESDEESLDALPSEEESAEAEMPAVEYGPLPSAPASVIEAEPSDDEIESTHQPEEDVYGFLENDDPEEGDDPSGKDLASPLAPSPFLTQEESGEPCVSTGAPSIPASSPAEAPPPADVSPPPDASVAPVVPPVEFPSILDAPVSGTGPEPQVSAPAIPPQEGSHLPPRRSAAPPVIPAGSPGASSLPPSPSTPAVKSAPEPVIDDTEFDFDPIAIFLQARESEDEAADSSAWNASKPSSPGEAPDDEPAIENESESGSDSIRAIETATVAPPRNAPWDAPSQDGTLESDTELQALFESPLPGDSGRPRANIPQRKSAPPHAAQVTNPTPYRSSVTPHAFAPAREAVGQASPPSEAPPASSPFLVAPHAHPETPPSLFSGAVSPETKSHKKRKSLLIQILLALTILACVGAGVFLYLNPEKNPFLRTNHHDTNQPSPLPVTPVRPDGSLPQVGLSEPAAIPTPAAPAAPEATPIDSPPPIVNATAIPPLTTDDLASIVRAPEKTLLAFLSVASNEERLQLVHRSEGISERMEAHSSLHGEGPIPYYAAVPKLSGTVPGTSFATHLFLVTTPSQPNGFPVSIEDTEEGFRVDWDVFVQFNDNLLESFLEDSSAPPATFFVVLRRGHFFGEEIPHLDEKLCYRIISPISAETEQFAFIDTRSPVGETAAKTLSWGRTFRPVVRLEWIREGDAAPYVAIADLVRTTWRGVGIGATSAE